MPIILRVENKEKYGVYSGKILPSGHYLRYNNLGNRPGPTSDYKLRQYILREGYTYIDLVFPFPEARFGFESVQQLLEWFDCSIGRKDINNNGGVVSFYYVPYDAICYGITQLVFDYERAIHLSSHNITKISRLYTVQQCHCWSNADVA